MKPNLKKINFTYVHSVADKTEKARAGVRFLYELRPDYVATLIKLAVTSVRMEEKIRFCTFSRFFFFNLNINREMSEENKRM